MSDVAVSITAQAIQRTIGERGDRTLEELARECFRLADTDDCASMCGTDDEQFRGGCGALLLLTEGEDQARVKTELKMLQALSAAMRGVPVDMAAAIQDGFEALGLLGLFREQKGKRP